MEFTVNVYVLLWWAGISILFAISSAVAYQRGDRAGYQEGLYDGLNAQLEKTGEHTYDATIKPKE